MKKTYSFDYQQYQELSDVSEKYQDLITSARELTNTSYSPYSNFAVSCSVLLDSGEIINGTNQENAAYPVGFCAEQSALLSVISQGKLSQVQAIAISYASVAGATIPISPCGKCRQFLLEVETRLGHKFPIFMTGQSGMINQVEGVSNLLPLAFNIESLDK